LKIDNSASKPLAGASTGPAKPAPTGSGKVASVPQAAPQDDVKLTPLSSQLQALESSLANVQVVDTARVEAIKQAISEGRFKINPDAVAERLLTSVKELVLKQNG
jgi:negative regulator of flagellin synthesis FlgM